MGAIFERAMVCEYGQDNLEHNTLKILFECSMNTNNK